MNVGLGIYPDISDKDFLKKITIKKEFLENKINNQQYGYILNYQKFLRNFMSILTNYNCILINHYTGLGKTLSSISIAESLKSRYKAVVISKNDILLNNFYQEIKNIYITPEQKQILHTGVDKEEIISVNKKVKSEINKNYSFYKYTDIKIDDQFNNNIIIIDEVHNITGNNFYDNIIGSLTKSSNIKLVLLSATPVFDKCYEIFYILNLLNVVSKKELLPVSPSVLQKLNLIKSKSLDMKSKAFNTKSEKLYELTESGEQKISENIKGKVSFLLPDTKYFAEKKYKGTHVIENNINSFIIYKSVMSSFQKQVYLKSLEDPGVLYKNSSDASTIVYPDSSTGETGYSKFIKNSKENSFLDIKNIKKYSCKLYSIFELIKKTKGIVFIYSNYVNNGGTNLVKEFLKKNGYSSYFSRANNKKYFIFNENTSLKTKEKILSILNSRQNKDGDLIKVVIGSPFISEGITFKNIKQIHILEPYWNFSRMDQVIGRGIRFKSHEDIPISERKVDIYLHVSVSDSENIDSSVDIYKYKICQFKDLNNKKVEYILKKNSVDCFLNKERNMLSDIYDYSRECQYKKCEYICPYELTDTKEIDISTYNIKIHDIEKYNFIKKCTKDIFKKLNICDIQYIYKYIKNIKSSIELDNIVFVLDEMISDNEILLNNKERECFLVKIKNYYIMNPKDNSVSESYYLKLV